MKGKIFHMAVRCHMTNDHVCDFCDDKTQPVVGCIQYEAREMKQRATLLHYCARCVLQQAEKMAQVVHPNYTVYKS